MKVRHYYYRERGTNHPRVFVCLVQDGNGEVARGVALCSLSERSMKMHVGRNKSHGRAVKALVNKRDDLPVTRNEAFAVYKCVPAFATWFQWKSFYNPRLTEFEQKLMADANS